MGRDMMWPALKVSLKPRFQSTLPAWGETGEAERQDRGADISIHSPCMGRDLCKSRRSRAMARFQSTLPAWGETLRQNLPDNQYNISIHSPCMGRDVMCYLAANGLEISIHSPCMGRDGSLRSKSNAGKNFNPLSLHGERLLFCNTIINVIRFQSTLPAWGETNSTIASATSFAISIHSPCMGRDII